MSEKWDPWPIYGDERRMWRVFGLLMWLATWAIFVSISWQLGQVVSIMQAILELSQ